MEASKGGHTTVVKLLIDYPNSISHLLPVVAPPPHPGLTASASDLAAGALLDGDPSQHLSMGLVIPAGDPQHQPVVLNPANQLIFNDIG